MAKHWVFDFDGTLVNSLPSYQQVLRDVLGERGILLSEHDLIHSRHEVMPDFLRRFVAEEDLMDAQEKVIQLSIQRQHEITIYDGVEGLLGYLKSKGCSLNVFTNRELVSTTSILKKTKLATYFDHVISRNCVEIPKPHPAGLYKIMELLAAESQQVVMVGDHPMDMQAARAAGVRGVSVDWCGFSSDIHELSQHHFTAMDQFHSWTQSIVF